MSAAKKYVVCPGRSCIAPNKALLKPGTPVPDGIPPKLLSEWEKTGFIRRVGAEAAPAESPKAIVDKDGGLKPAKEKVITTGKFNYDPDKLEGKTLEELNVMLVDLNADPAETIKEAIGLLSADRNA